MTQAPAHSPIAVTPETGQAAGAVLLAAAVLIVAAMAHHPAGIEPSGGGGGMTFGNAIHAAMIVLLAANLWGLTVFALRLSLGGMVLAGLVAYGVSFTGNLIAGLTNGFVVPALAMDVDPAVSRELFALLWKTNQAAAQLGIYAASAAFVAWSLALLARKTGPDRVIGGLGLAAALLPAVALYTGLIRLDVHGALVAYGVQAAWTGLVGLQMLRQKL